MEFPFASRIYEPEVCKADVAGAAAVGCTAIAEIVLIMKSALNTRAIGLVNLL